MVQKFKVFSLPWIWYLDYFEYVKFDSDGHFSVLDFFASFFFKKFIWHFSRVFVIYHAKNIIVRYSFRFWFKKLFLTKLLSRISRQTWTSSFTWNIDLKEKKSCNKTVSESFKTLFHLAVMSNNILTSNISSVFQPCWTFQGKKKIREQYRKSDKERHRASSWNGYFQGLLPFLLSVNLIKKENMKKCFCGIIYFYSKWA